MQNIRYMRNKCFPNHRDHSLEIMKLLSSNIECGGANPYVIVLVFRSRWLLFEWAHRNVIKHNIIIIATITITN